eukprot:scaffold11.g3860.t1
MAYDAYATDVDIDAPEGVSYAEWEAQQHMRPVKLPAWLERFLRLPGAGILVLLILFPLTLVLIVLLFALWLICLPFNILLSCCGIRPPPPPEGGAHPQAEEERRAAYAAAAAGAVPAQQAAPARILYVRNLPFNISSEEIYEIFGKYGGIRQVRVGANKETRGTAYVVYDDIWDAKTAQEHLSGFNVQNRYLIVLYYNPRKHSTKLSTKEEEEQLRKLQEQHGVDGQQHPRAKA